jgi:hypothetical protein
MAALAVGSMAMSVMGGMQQAQAQRTAAAQQASQSYYAAGIARNNQIAASHAARDEVQRGKIDRAQEAIKSRQMQGAQRAALAASGVVVDQGSAVGLTNETRRLGQLNQLTATNAAARRAQALTTQGANFGSQVGLNQAAATNQIASGKAAATGTLLSTAGSVASKWYDFSSAGAFK